MTKLEALLTRLGSHPLPTIALGLDRIQQALEALGNPHQDLPPVVHVAGTNGKGSTIAFLRAILEAAGFRVHSYTSPHLIRFNERIVLAGKEIDDAALTEILEEVIAATEDMPLTFFESTTAAAFLAFSRTEADILLLEVGLGGRLDATNVIASPVLTILTPISYDHMDYLGEELSGIATEKAGILKKNIPCIVAGQEPEAWAVIEQKAQEVGAPLYRQDKEWNITEEQDGLAYHSSHRYFDNLKVSLTGKHQITNAGAAIAAAEKLKRFQISHAHILQGLSTAYWPARLQRIYPEKMPPEVEVYVDGGHNVAGMQVIAEWISAQDHPVHVVLGMLKDKQVAESASVVSGVAASLTVTTIQQQARALEAGTFCEQLQQQGIKVKNASDWQAAVQAILQGNQPPFTILITGSLYLAGEVLLALSAETSN